MTSEEKQKIYDLYLIHNQDEKKVCAMTELSIFRLRSIVDRMSMKHIEAIRKMRYQKDNVIRDEETLSRYFYNTKYPKSPTGVILNAL